MSALWGDASAGVARLLVDGTLRGSLLLLIAAGASLALRRSSAAMRHVVWTAGIAGLLLVAPLSGLLPAWPVAVPGRLAPFAETVRRTDQPAEVSAPPSIAQSRAGVVARVPEATREPERATAGIGLSGLLLLIWMVGAEVLAASFLVAGWRLARILRTAAPVDDMPLAQLADSVARDLGVARSRFSLRWTEQALTPMTWGLWRPVVLLPRTCMAWEEERMRQVLVHEIAHVGRFDALTQVLSSLACVVYWFNPLVWWAARQMLTERERACDDRVLCSGAKASTYAHELLEIARALGAGWTTARISPAMARRSQISGRLLAVLDPDVPRYGASRRALLASVLGGLLLLVPLAAVVPVRAGSGVPVGVAAPATTTRLDLEEARRGLAAAQQGLREALNRRDAAGMARIYAEDAVAVAPGALPIRGRRAVQDAMQNMLDQGIVDVQVRTAELYPVGGEVCELGRLTFLTSHGVAAEMRFMTLWKKEDGQWRIYRDYATP